MPKEGYKVCPYCAEEIREKAIKCRFCGSMLEELPSTAQVHEDAKRNLEEIKGYKNF